MFTTPSEPKLGSTVEPIPWYPPPIILVEQHGVTEDELQGAMFVAMLTGDTQPVKDLYTRAGIPEGTIPTGTPFRVVQECDGELCDCGAIVAEFTAGPLAGEEMALYKDQFLVETVAEVAGDGVFSVTDEDAIARMIYEVGGFDLDGDESA